VHAINQMLADRDRKTDPADFRHSFAKDHTTQLIAQARHFLWVVGRPETVDQFKESLALLLSRLHALVDKSYQHSAGTQVLTFRHILNFFRK
jgi:hypothetical protein